MAVDPYRYTYKAWAEAFEIFAKYNSGYANVDFQQDVIYAGSSLDTYSLEDHKRLGELGWNYDDHLDFYFHYS